MLIISLYVISVIVSLYLLNVAAKADFKYVTIGGEIVLVGMSLIPVFNLAWGVCLWLTSSANKITFFSKKLF